MKIVYKKQATLDIQSTRDYISNRLCNEKAAKKLVTSILKAISLLADNPMMGASLGEKFEIENDIRYFVVDKQLVFYEITDADTLTILHVLDGRQDYLAILFG